MVGDLLTPTSGSRPRIRRSALASEWLAARGVYASSRLQPRRPRPAGAAALSKRRRSPDVSTNGIQSDRLTSCFQVKSSDKSEYSGGTFTLTNVAAGNFRLSLAAKIGQSMLAPALVALFYPRRFLYTSLRMCPTGGFDPFAVALLTLAPYHLVL